MTFNVISEHKLWRHFGREFHILIEHPLFRWSGYIGRKVNGNKESMDDFKVLREREREMVRWNVHGKNIDEGEKRGFEEILKFEQRRKREREEKERERERETERDRQREREGLREKENDNTRERKDGEKNGERE